MNKYWHLVFFVGILSVMIFGGFIIGSIIKYIAVMELADGISILMGFGSLLIFIMMYILSTHAGDQLNEFVEKRLQRNNNA